MKNKNENNIKISKSNNSWIIVGIVLIIIILAGLYFFSNQSESKDVVKVGVLTPITGPASFYGTNIIEGIECAKSLLNEQGGINGKAIELVTEDSQCDKNIAISAANKLIDIDGVNGIIGEACSSAVIPLGAIAESKKIIIIASAASNPAVTLSPYVFRVNPNDFAQAKAIAEYLTSNFNKSKIAILSINDEYGVGLVNEFKKFYSGEIVTDELFDSTAQDFKTNIAKLGAEKFDVLFIIALPGQHPVISNQLAEFGKNWTKIADFNFGMVPSEAITLSMNGTIYPITKFDKSSNKNSQILNECMMQKYGKGADLLSAWGFDSLYVFAKSAELCKPLDGECIKTNLIGLNYEGAYGNNKIMENHEIEKFNVEFVK